MQSKFVRNLKFKKEISLKYVFFVNYLSKIVRATASLDHHNEDKHKYK